MKFERIFWILWIAVLLLLLFNVVSATSLDNPFVRDNPDGGYKLIYEHDPTVFPFGFSLDTCEDHTNRLVCTFHIIQLR